MLQGFRARLSFANVISVIALFVALGGGYAAAFSGGGSLDKARTTGLGPSFETVLELTNIGSLKAKCEGDGEVTARIKSSNSTDELLTYNERAGSGYVFANLNSGDTDDETFTIDAWRQLYMHSREPDDRRPQVQITYTIEAGDDCGSASVTAFALSTEE